MTASLPAPVVEEPPATERPTMAAAGVRLPITELDGVLDRQTLDAFVSCYERMMAVAPDWQSHARLVDGRGRWTRVTPAAGTRVASRPRVIAPTPVPAPAPVIESPQAAAVAEWSVPTPPASEPVQAAAPATLEPVVATEPLVPEPASDSPWGFDVAAYTRSEVDRSFSELDAAA